MKSYFPMRFFEEVYDSRPIPLILKVWFFLLVLWALSNTFFSDVLRGVRIGHQVYYIEFLFPFALFALFSKPKYIKLPRIVVVWGIWLVVMAIVGYFKGNLPSLIYDRARNWGAMVLLLLLLYRFQVSSFQLLKMLKPVFIAALIGYPLAILFPPTTQDNLVRIQDLIGFNFMAAAYAIAVILTDKQFQWWYVWAIGATSIVPVYVGARAKLLAMLASMIIPAILLKRNVFHMIKFVVPVLAIAIITVYLIKPVEQAEQKSFRSGGLAAASLKDTSAARLLEFSAIANQMGGSEYVVGKGAGSTWNGINIYEESVGLERQNFHIYYLEILYWYGLVGIILWLFVGVKPVFNKLFSLQTLNPVGLMGFCCQVALLLSWFGHAGYSICEGSFIAVSLYALRIGSKHDQVSYSSL